MATWLLFQYHILSSVDMNGSWFCLWSLNTPAEKVKAFFSDLSVFLDAAPETDTTTAVSATALLSGKDETKEELEDSDEDMIFGLFDYSSESNQLSQLNLRITETKCYFF